MAHRLELLSEKIKQVPIYVDSCYDFMQNSSFLTKEENDIRLKVRTFSQTQVLPHIHSYVEQAKFPQFGLAKLKQLDPLQYFLRPPYGKNLSSGGMGTLIAQMSRVDAGFATMVLVQYGLAAFTIQQLGSQKQKEKYLPKLRSFQWIGGWGLTEEKYGSDASSLQTSVTKIGPQTYKINGNKRWIGNGNRDLVIIWARNTQNKKVQAYVVENNNVTGLTSQAIKHKLPLRVVQNCHITLNNVIVKEQHKLPKAVDFVSGTNKILKHSRVYVCWLCAGVCIGIYDNAIKYISNRKQFGRSISGFQLVQEKIVKVMANTQAVLLMCYRLSQLVDQGIATMGQIAMTKAWVTQRARQIARWGRQVCGGNGIIHDNYVMKALADIEAIYTYEGTYDINTLVAGRQLTGVSAFK